MELECLVCLFFIGVSCGSLEEKGPQRDHTYSNHDFKTAEAIVSHNYNFDDYQTFEEDRSWRKNRNPGVKCVGVDINRNFDTFWGEGSSSNECKDDYRGSHPFSEKESIAISKFILKKRNTIKVYITLHSFGQIIMFPWAGKTEKPWNYNKLLNTSEQSVMAIKNLTGRVYKNGQISQLMYQVGGSSADWSYGVANVSIAFAIELRDTESFELDAQEIGPTYEELLAILKVIDVE